MHHLTAGCTSLLRFNTPLVPNRFHCETQVFQTFSCAHFDEVGKHYLWADFKIECYTPKHNAYMMYAGVMIVICECLPRFACLVVREQNQGAIFPCNL